MRRFLLVFLLLVLVALGGWFAYQRYWLPRQTAVQTPTYETVRVERGAIASTVNASGSIEPEAEVSLAFRSVGPVAAVYVTAGQAAEEGQLLAELGTTDLTLALAQTRVTQEINEAQLAKLETPPDPDDIAAAQAAVEVAQVSVAGADAALASAQAAYRTLLAGPSEVQRQVDEAQVRQAEATVKQAQQAYNEVRNLPNVGALPQAAELERATIALEAARAQALLTGEPPTEAEIASALNQIAQAEVSLRRAQSDVITAQNNLQTLLEGPNVEDVRIAQAQLRQAQLSVLQSENNLANARLVAPFSGVISQVNVRAGEQAPAGPAFVLTDLDRFHMAVLVDEIDVRQIALGQPVRIRVDALPDTELVGQVAGIAPTAADVGGVIAYEVTIVPDEADAPLRSGMSATAIITTANVEDVLLVPNRFIQVDRENDRAYVYKMVAGAPVLQEVELGLRNDRSSQVLAGLTDGDELALVTRTAEEQLRGALFGGE